MSGLPSSRWFRSLKELGEIGTASLLKVYEQDED